MRKIILLMHVSLDGFVAGPSGEMNWIKVDDELWNYVENITSDSDTGIFGANTFKMMESYWPTAADMPEATAHDSTHAKWVNAAQKIVFSDTITHSDWKGTEFLKGNPLEEMQRRKSQPGKNMLMIGSPTIAQEFMRLGLIDEYRLNVNPVILGKGKKLFAENELPINLTLIESKSFATGVQAMHYNLLAD